MKSQTRSMLMLILAFATAPQMSAFARQAESRPTRPCSAPKLDVSLDAFSSHQPGYTACDATPEFARHLTPPIERKVLEAALGSPGIDPSTGKPTRRSSGAYRIHWDGPHTFWTADIVHGTTVVRIEGYTSEGGAFVIDQKGMHHP